MVRYSALVLRFKPPPIGIGGIRSRVSIRRHFSSCPLGIDFQWSLKCQPHSSVLESPDGCTVVLRCLLISTEAACATARSSTMPRLNRIPTKTIASSRCLYHGRLISVGNAGIAATEAVPAHFPPTTPMVLSHGRASTRLPPPLDLETATLSVAGIRGGNC